MNHILDADIAGFFDAVGQEWLKSRELNELAVLKQQLEKLQAGFRMLEEGERN